MVRTQHPNSFLPRVQKQIANWQSQQNIEEILSDKVLIKKVSQFHEIFVNSTKIELIYFYLLPKQIVCEIVHFDLGRSIQTATYFFSEKTLFEIAYIKHLNDFM